MAINHIQMKPNSVLRISVLPLILFVVIAFTNAQPDKRNNQKDKENKSQEQPTSKGNNKDSKGDKNNAAKGNNNRDNKDNNNGNSDAGDKNGGKGNDGQNQNANKGKNSNGNSKMMNGKRDMDIDWGLDNFANRKHPKNQKKVTVCHNPSNDNSNGVSISISENALQAHMNHGDKVGDCTIDYSDRWSSNYVRSRENVYNTYEQAWESMSYSEALLKLGIEKLLGVRTNLDQNRTSMTSSEIQRRELLINDLQNNVNSLENQLGSTRQRLDSDVSIMINL